MRRSNLRACLATLATALHCAACGLVHSGTASPEAGTSGGASESFGTEAGGRGLAGSSSAQSGGPVDGGALHDNGGAGAGGTVRTGRTENNKAACNMTNPPQYHQISAIAGAYKIERQRD